MRETARSEATEPSTRVHSSPGVVLAPILATATSAVDLEVGAGIGQVQWGTHVAALAGIVALAVLGGVLVLRKRLTGYDRGTETFSPSDEEFLSDRERVHHLVDENGGRMKQSEIVDAVDWSKAKVSRLLADLEEDGEITKLRLGRENLICLEGREPTASKSSDGSGTD